MQRQARDPGLGPTTHDVHATAARGVTGEGGPLPHLDVIQRAFGRNDVSGVRAHTDTAARNASAEIGAEAYATGNDVAFAGTPSLHTAAHEAAHIVQQRGGVQLKGGVGEAGDPYEQHADQVADAVVAGRSAEPLFAQVAGGGSGGPASGVQLKPADFKTGAAIEAMTLTQFDAYARMQADWGTGPAITYLQGVLGSERWFPARLGVSAKLDGLATENEILIAIDRAKPSAKTPDPNVDTDRDGKNDAYVEPMTKTAKVDVPSADIYEKADNTSKKLASLAKGTEVRVIGKASAAWLAIEYNGGTAFAQVIDIAV